IFMSNVSSSNSQAVRVPKLRFKDESGCDFPQYQAETVRSLFKHISRRNTTMENSNVITNSAEYGLIPQRDFFDKDIAVEGNTEKYYIIEQGDFVYNPRKSTTAPYGPFNCYQGDKEGIVSPLYTCLKPLHRDFTEYLLWYFKSPAWYSYIYHNGAQGGARHDRVGMTTELMDGIPVHLPCLDEQKKISEFLSTLEKRIDKQRQLVELLKSYKRGVLSKLFPQNDETTPQYRFAGFTEPWECRKINDIADRFDNLRIPVTSNLRIAGNTPYYGANGIQDYVEGFTHDGEFVLVAEDGANDLQNYPVRRVQGKIWVNNHAHVLQGKQGVCDNSFLAYSIGQTDIESLLVGGGRAKLNADTMMNIKIYLPKLDEQMAIGNFISNLDCLIIAYQHKVDELQVQKSALLQQLFI
ncbi:MAG: restriction endonuclease subunit S, partial [Butyrivibrio sp.]|nr:restriction endonuclease subunit S [Butyrivibrio sp.]